MTQLEWNTSARVAARQELGAWPPDDSGLSPADAAELLRGWAASGRVVVVETPSGPWVPAVQFRDGQPRPVIAEILDALDGSLQGWGVVLWLTGSNGWLDGVRPVDLLDSDPRAIVAAAREQAGAGDD